MPLAVEPLAVEQLEHDEDFRDVGVSGATLMVRDGLGARLSPQNLADFVEVALKVRQRWVVNLLAAIEPFGDLRDLASSMPWRRCSRT